MKIVLIASGGVDSTVLLYRLLTEGHEIRTLSFIYGQRHVKEVEAARLISGGVGVPHGTVNLGGDLCNLLYSALTTPGSVIPEGHYTDESMKVTVVPNRNMIMLSIAIGYAISVGSNTVAFGAHSGDHAIYPDCRPEFVDAMDSVARVCSFDPIIVHAPFVTWSKQEIVEAGSELKVPFELTWSCYKGGEKHCGKCGTCVERREAFASARIPDPTEYEG